MIMITLSSVLGSFGDSNAGINRRTTNTKPTKSMLIGLVGAALGMKKEDEEYLNKLNNEISFASFNINKGTNHREYSNARTQKFRKADEWIIFSSKNRKDELYHKKGFPTNKQIEKDYLSNDITVVAIHVEDKDFEEKIFKALKFPKYNLFIGRKANIPFHMAPCLYKEDDFISNLNHYIENKVLIYQQIIPSFNIKKYGQVFFEPRDNSPFNKVEINNIYTVNDLCVSFIKREFRNRIEAVGFIGKEI